MQQQQQPFFSSSLVSMSRVSSTLTPTLVSYVLHPCFSRTPKYVSRCLTGGVSGWGYRSGVGIQVGTRTTAVCIITAAAVPRCTHQPFISTWRRGPPGGAARCRRLHGCLMRTPRLVRSHDTCTSLDALLDKSCGKLSLSAVVHQLLLSLKYGRGRGSNTKRPGFPL